MTAPKPLRDLIVVGAVLDVTNHYITREDHPCYGTNRRTVTALNGSAFYMDGSRQEWPKAARFTVHEGGVVKLYGGGVAQQPTDLFLTLTPVPVEATA